MSIGQRVRYYVIEWRIGWHQGHKMRQQAEADRHAAREVDARVDRELLLAEVRRPRRARRP